MEKVDLPRPQDRNGQVKAYRVSKDEKKSRRGRPAVDWTLSRQRRLLRLYLFTPESFLSIDDICNVLKEDSFAPQ
jgi:hypothetical protein